MHYLGLLALAATAVSALSLPWTQHQQRPIADTAEEKFLIELSPGEVRWVTEDQKWVLRRV